MNKISAAVVNPDPDRSVGKDENGPLRIWVPETWESPDRVVHRGDRQTRYLAQSIVLEEAGNSRLVRMALSAVSAVVLAFILWAALTVVDEVATASGEIIPSGQVQAIQHLEGGILSELLVRDGDSVEQGQTLFRLDPASSLAELEQVRARNAALTLKTERLRAIIEERKPDFSIIGAKYTALVSDQRALYRGQIDAHVNRRAVLKNQIRQRNAELETSKEQEATFRRNLELTEEELQLYEKMFRKGISSRTVYLNSRREVNLARGDLSRVKGERNQTNEAISELESRILELDTNLKEDSLLELGEATSEIAEINQALKKLEDRFRRLEVVAPVRGIIKGMTVHTLGGVIAPGEVVLEIVPLDQELVAEVHITSRDIGHIRRGQPVKVKVVTYDFARYGGISGNLTKISATTFLDEEGVPFYKGVVTLDRGYVGTNPRENRVSAGMTVQADIQTGDKTLLQYLLKPVYNAVNQSFRER